MLQQQKSVNLFETRQLHNKSMCCPVVPILALLHSTIIFFSSKRFIIYTTSFNNKVALCHTK